ncbi:MAG: hypothetical protein WD595_05925 [Waddliaceae bacterium]
MWPKNYQDYPEDALLKKEKVESGKGIVGCEMHDVNGWGETFHHKKTKAKKRKK